MAGGLPPTQPFKSSYLPQRAALVPIWRKGVRTDGQSFHVWKG